MKLDKSNNEGMISKREVIKKIIEQYNFLDHIWFYDIFDHFLYKIILNDVNFISDYRSYHLYGNDFMFSFDAHNGESYPYFYKIFPDDEVYSMFLNDYAENIYKTKFIWVNVDSFKKLISSFSKEYELISSLNAKEFGNNYKYVRQVLHDDYHFKRNNMLIKNGGFVKYNEEKEKIDVEFIEEEYYKVRKNKRPNFINSKSKYIFKWMNKLSKNIRKKIYDFYYDGNFEGVYLFFEGYFIQIPIEYGDDCFIVKNINGNNQRVFIRINCYTNIKKGKKTYDVVSIRKQIKYLNKFMKEYNFTNVSLDELKKLPKEVISIRDYYDEKIEEKLTPKTDLFMTKDEFISSYKKENVLVKGFFDEINYYYYDIINKYANYVSFKSDGIDHSFMLYSDKCILEIRFNRGYNLFIYYKDNDKLVFKPIGDYLYDYISREKRVIYWASELMKKEDIIFNVGNEIKELVVPYCYIKDEEKEELIKYLK